MRTTSILFTAAFLALIAVSACETGFETTISARRPVLPEKPYDYSVQAVFNSRFGNGNIQTDFGLPGVRFNAGNPKIVNEGATLGRVLFYDPQLSLNNAISCASCHKQELAFSDGVAGSTGFEGRVTPRNSMAIINPGFNNNLFWDSRVQHVAQLATKPIQNHIEMGMEDMRVLESKLAKSDYYAPLFKAAFGDEQITEERISSALAQFVCSITTNQSKFDREENFQSGGFTSLEKLGRALYFSERTNCNRCHAAPTFAAPDFPGGEYGDGGGTITFVDSLGNVTFLSAGDGKGIRGSANNGLALVYKDQGLGNGKFRIPSLRNIALTGPYMHDGSIKTLEDVIEHYNSGIKPHTHLDKNLKEPSGAPKRMNLTALEKKALVAFLHTLTDENMLRDPKYSDPFR